MAIQQKTWERAWDSMGQMLENHQPAAEPVIIKPRVKNMAKIEGFETAGPYEIIPEYQWKFGLDKNSLTVCCPVVTLWPTEQAKRWGIDLQKRFGRLTQVSEYNLSKVDEAFDCACELEFWHGGSCPLVLGSSGIAFRCWNEIVSSAAEDVDTYSNYPIWNMRVHAPDMLVPNGYNGWEALEDEEFNPNFRLPYTRRVWGYYVAEVLLSPMAHPNRKAKPRTVTPTLVTQVASDMMRDGESRISKFLGLFGKSLMEFFEDPDIPDYLVESHPALAKWFGFDVFDDDETTE